MFKKKKKKKVMTQEKTTRPVWNGRFQSKALSSFLKRKNKYKQNQSSKHWFWGRKKKKQTHTHIIVLIIATKSQIFEYSIFVYKIPLRYEHDKFLTSVCISTNSTHKNTRPKLVTWQSNHTKKMHYLLSHHYGFPINTIFK